MGSLRDQTRRSAFTLIELMVVILIIGSMVAVTSMNWHKVMPRAQLNSAVRGISNVLNGTRSEAIARNAEFRVLYDLDEQSYWVETPFKKTGGLALLRVPGEIDPEEGNRGITNMTKLKDGVTFAQVKIDEETYTDGQVYVSFNPLGASSEHTVELHHRPTDNSYTVEVLALTGLIRFHEGSFERDIVDEGDFR